MTNPRRQLEAIVALAQSAAVGWEQYEATEAALAASTIPGSGGGAHGGDTPDPVYGVVLSHERYYETCAEVAEALGMLRSIQSRMSRKRRDDPAVARDVDAAKLAARCSGEVDPSCVSNAVKDGLCSPCFWRRYRAEVRADQPMDVS